MGLPARPRVAVAMSGGVDSLCALLLLTRQKFDVIAVHGLFTAGARVSPAVAQVCRGLGVELAAFNLAGAFSREVVEPFAAGCSAGSTPNPCVACNRQIKFGILQDMALALGADAVATGHYAAKRHFGGRPVPALAADSSRDQTYFLGMARQRALVRAIFPLAGLTKRECRAIVAEAGLKPPEPRESQDICFAGKDWQKFLAEFYARQGFAPGAPGPVMLLDESGPRRIGGHGGNLWRFTVGQRKGLGIPWREPLYVCGKDVPSNTLYVAGAAGAMADQCRAGELNIFVPQEHWRGPLFARLRHRQKLFPVKAAIEGSEMLLKFESPRLPSAPGQLAALFNADGWLLAAGIIAF